MIINIISCNERRQRVLKFAIEAWQMPTEICVLPAPFVNQKKIHQLARQKKKARAKRKESWKSWRKIFAIIFLF